MDKKWWEHEQRLCESHGLHILAQSAHNIAEGIQQKPSILERARAELVRREQEVKRTFCKRGTKRLVITVHPRGK